jgi:hypothetical protein
MIMLHAANSTFFQAGLQVPTCEAQICCALVVLTSAVASAWTSCRASVRAVSQTRLQRGQRASRWEARLRFWGRSPSHQSTVSVWGHGADTGPPDIMMASGWPTSAREWTPLSTPRVAGTPSRAAVHNRPRVRYQHVRPKVSLFELRPARAEHRKGHLRPGTPLLASGPTSTSQAFRVHHVLPWGNGTVRMTGMAGGSHSFGRPRWRKKRWSKQEDLRAELGQQRSKGCRGILAERFPTCGHAPADSCNVRGVAMHRLPLRA